MSLKFVSPEILLGISTLKFSRKIVSRVDEVLLAIFISRFIALGPPPFAEKLIPAEAVVSKSLLLVKVAPSFKIKLNTFPVPVEK